MPRCLRLLVELPVKTIIGSSWQRLNWETRRPTRLMSNMHGRQLGFLIIPFGLVNNHPAPPLGIDKSLSVELATKATSYLSFTCPAIKPDVVPPTDSPRGLVRSTGNPSRALVEGSQDRTNSPTAQSQLLPWHC